MCLLRLGGLTFSFKLQCPTMTTGQEYYYERAPRRRVHGRLRRRLGKEAVAYGLNPERKSLNPNAKVIQRCCSFLKIRLGRLRRPNPGP